MTTSVAGKMTLLDMVQDILASMNSDEVNSITDTVESEQVAREIRTAFYEILSNLREPHQHVLRKLEAVSDINKPTHLKIPEAMNGIECYSYDIRVKDSDKVYWRDLTYLPPEDFLVLTGTYREDSAAQEVEDFNGVKILVLNNEDPIYYTSFDETYVITNAFDSDKDDTLIEDKTRVLGYELPTFSLTDSFIPPIPATKFPLLLSEAKQACFINFKQVSNQLETIRSRRQKVMAQNDRNRAKENKDKETHRGVGGRRTWR